VKRILGLVAAVVVAGLLATAAGLGVTGLDPHERRPGLWLRGEAEKTPVTDWSFTDRYPTIYVQTHTPYLLPHSVTVTCVSHGGQLFLTSVFREGSAFPDGKLWTKNVMRDPRVRLKIGDQVFDRKLALVSDATERDAVLADKAKKYPEQRVPKTATVHLFRVLPG